jgi:hypothetical protein
LANGKVLFYFGAQLEVAAEIPGTMLSSSTKGVTLPGAVRVNP